MDISTEIGSRMRDRRKQCNLSQQQLSVLAFGTDSHQNVISSTESGKRKNVNFDTVFKIFKAMDIDIFAILDQSNKKKPAK